MKYPTAALFFVIGCFIFFCFWAVASYILGTTVDALSPFGEQLASDNFNNMISMLQWAFGIICAIFFVSALVVVFVLEALSDEPEYYEYRR